MKIIIFLGYLYKICLNKKSWSSNSSNPDHADSITPYYNLDRQLPPPSSTSHHYLQVGLHRSQRPVIILSIIIGRHPTTTILWFATFIFQPVLKSLQRGIESRYQRCYEPFCPWEPLDIRVPRSAGVIKNVKGTAYIELRKCWMATFV